MIQHGEGRMIQLLSLGLLWITLLLISFAVQQLMKQMRTDVDSQRDLKLAKQQFVWTLWPEHRQLFPQSRLRKCHFLLIIGAITIIAALLTAPVRLIIANRRYTQILRSEADSY